MTTFLIASVILTALEMLVVSPLAVARLRRRIAMEGTPADSSAGLKLANRVYIQTDVAVLAIAGLVAGLFGHWFIGITLRKRGWPGMLCFMISSFVTCFLVLFAKALR